LSRGEFSVEAIRRFAFLNDWLNQASEEPAS
jgi:hypothetical protein